MSSAQLQEKLSGLQEQERQLLDQTDSIVDESRREMAQAAAPWIDNAVRVEIQEHPDAVEKMVAGRLKQLKDEITALKERIPAVIDHLLGDKSGWPHHRQTPDGPNPYVGSSGGFIKNTFGEVVGELGVILRKYGLTETKAGSTQRWAARGDERYCYTQSVYFGDNQGSTSKKYAELASKIGKLREEIRVTQTALAKAKANELWDSV